MAKKLKYPNCFRTTHFLF